MYGRLKAKSMTGQLNVETLNVERTHLGNIFYPHQRKETGVKVDFPFMHLDFLDFAFLADRSFIGHFRCGVVVESA